MRAKRSSRILLRTERLAKARHAVRLTPRPGRIPKWQLLFFQTYWWRRYVLTPRRKAAIGKQRFRFSRTYQP